MTAEDFTRRVDAAFTGTPASTPETRTQALHAAVAALAPLVSGMPMRPDNMNAYKADVLLLAERFDNYIILGRTPERTDNPS